LRTHAVKDVTRVPEKNEKTLRTNMRQSATRPPAEAKKPEDAKLTAWSTARKQ